jgi:hypothetical protein
MAENLQQYERIPDNLIKHKKNFDPSTYKSIQDRVNNDPEFEQKYFNQLIAEGWVKLKYPENLINYTPGKLFKYRLNGNSLAKTEAGTFRSGGFFLRKALDSDDYILYKAYNGCIFPLQIADLLEVYVKDDAKEVIKFKLPTNPTKNPVYLPHPITQEPIVVYYAKKPSQAITFQNTIKFKKAQKFKNWTFEMDNYEHTENS